MNLSRLKQKVAGLPQEAGVYFFYGKAESALGGPVKRGPLLYIGKATNLKTRVASYFRNNTNLQMNANGANMQITNVNAPELSSENRSLAPVPNVPGRSEWIGSMMPLVEEIEFEQTDSVLEALILESNLIKKHQPKYNTLEKDDKSFAYYVITKEEFPKVLIMRKTDIEKVHSSQLLVHRKKAIKKRPVDGELVTKNIYGPYTSKQQMQIALKIMRRIFPFHAGKQKTEKGCLDFQLGLCPGPYAGAISKEDYKKNIDGIKLILSGKKKRLLSGLEKEMKVLAKQNEFEKAAQVRNKIFALQHIRDVALITRETHNVERITWNTEHKIQDTRYNNQEDSSYSGTKKLMPEKLTPDRIEAYDISNISGMDAVGSMVVFSARDGNWQPNKSEYRKFKIKTVDGSNDVAMMKEVLLRRFKNDWAMPDLILLDGGIGHVNMAEKLLRQELGLDVAIVGVAKGPTRKNLKLQMANSKQNTIYNIQNTSEIDARNLNDDIRYILQDKLLIKRIMDEAHRFAITFHRKLRGKNALR